VCQRLRPNASFWWLLVRLDEEIARKTRGSGCQHCGGPLHRADYPRKPRGDLGEAEQAFETRWSFCCGRCRKRATPPSVRFLGRRVYVGQLVVAACLSWQELLGQVGKLVEGVPRRTVKRWLHWWRELLPGTRFWQQARARFMPPVDADAMPRSLVERFAELAQVLVFLTPLTTRSTSYVRVDPIHAEDGVSR